MNDVLGGVIVIVYAKDEWYGLDMLFQVRIEIKWK